MSARQGFHTPHIRRADRRANHGVGITLIIMKTIDTNVEERASVIAAIADIVDKPKRSFVDELYLKTVASNLGISYNHLLVEARCYKWRRDYRPDDLAKAVENSMP